MDTPAPIRLLPRQRVAEIEALPAAMGMTVAEQRELCRGYRFMLDMLSARPAPDHQPEVTP